MLDENHNVNNRSIKIKYIQTSSNAEEIYFIKINRNYEIIELNQSASIFFENAFKVSNFIKMNIFNLSFFNYKKERVKENIENSLCGKSISEIVEIEFNEKKYYEVIYFSHDVNNFRLASTTILVKDITVNYLNEISLKLNEERLNQLFQRAPLGYQSLNSNGFINDVNEMWLNTLGYQKEEVIGTWIGNYIDPDQISFLKSNFVKFKEKGKIHAEYNFKHKDGHFVTMSLDGRISYKGDQFERTHCIVNDITEHLKFQNQIIESEEKYRLLFSEMNQGIAHYKIILNEDGIPIDYIFTDANDYFLKMFDLSKESIIGKRATEVMPKVEKYWIDVFGKVALTGVSCNYDNYFEQTGRYYSTHSYMTKPGFFAVIARDITESKKAEENILYLSYHDQLTGLYNRRFYDEELKRLDTQRNFPITLIMGDINGLKLINDSFGHPIGDELIRNIANAITSACREDDIIARLGGDEFIVILPHTDQSSAENVLKRIKNKINEIRSEFIQISVSFGCSTKNSSEESTTVWIKRTEDEMYKNKVYESHSMRSRTIDLIMKTLFEKNSREMLHSTRVSEICGKLATYIGLSSEEINKIKLTGLMHDIGKIGIDEKILNSN